MTLRKVLAIVEKDARHLWPQIAAFWALLALASALDPTYTHRRPSSAEAVLWTALPLACWYLVMAAIHENLLPGDRQYWLTRPYTRSGLVMAKALFIGLSVNLPVLLAHATVMVFLGIPPWQHLSVLAWQQVFLTAFAILPPAAVAAVTTGLRQVVLTALGIAVPLLLGTATFSFLTRHPVFFFNPQFGMQFWLKTAINAAILILGAAAVLLLQYRWRVTAWSRAVLAAVAVMVLTAGSVVRRDQSFAVQAWLSPTDAGASAMHLELDTDPARLLNVPYSRPYGVTRVEIPVRVAGPLPDAILSAANTARTAIQGRTVNAEISEQPPGRWWLSLELPTDYFNTLKNTAVDLDGSIDLTLFRRGVSLPAPRLLPVPVPGIGVCRNRRDFDGRLALECYSPSPRVALSVEFPGGGRQRIVSHLTADVPFPTPDEFQTVEEFSSPASFGSLDEIAPLRLVTEEPMGHLRTHFRFPAIRLADFSYPRTSPRRR